MCIIHLLLDTVIEVSSSCGTKGCIWKVNCCCLDILILVWCNKSISCFESLIVGICLDLLYSESFSSLNYFLETCSFKFFKLEKLADLFNSLSSIHFLLKIDCCSCKHIWKARAPLKGHFGTKPFWKARKHCYWLKARGAFLRPADAIRAIDYLIKGVTRKKTSLSTAPIALLGQPTWLVEVKRGEKVLYMFVCFLAYFCFPFIFELGLRMFMMRACDLACFIKIVFNCFNPQHFAQKKSLPVPCRPGWLCLSFFNQYL